MQYYDANLTLELHRLLAQLQRVECTTPTGQIPRNGVYVVFEEGEVFQKAGQQWDRIVRIGTHVKDGRLRARIRQHYGRVTSFGGNKNASVFRKHLGGALLRRADPRDSRLVDWLAQGSPSSPEVEDLVSRELRNKFWFVCVPVETAVERLTLESALIALLAHFPVGQPSEKWLGHSAADERIGRCGLWNTQHINSLPLTYTQFKRLGVLVRQTVVKEAGNG